METESLFFEYLAHERLIAHGMLFSHWRRGRAIALGLMSWSEAQADMRREKALQGLI